MKAHPFQVGDKVVLTVNPGQLTMVPRLVPGRVYCVRETGVMETPWAACANRVCLVGVRRNRRHKIKLDTDCLPASYFRRVSKPPFTPQPKGGA